MKTVNKQFHTIKKIPLTLVLVIPFVLQIFAAVGLVGYLSFIQGRKAVSDLANQLIDKTSQQVDEHLDKYLSLPQKLNQMNADAIAIGKINLTEQRANEQYFWTQAKAFSNISYIGYTLANGREAGAGRWLDSVNLIVYENIPGDKASDYLADNRGNRSQLLQSYEFDPLSLDSYKDVVKAGKPIWGKILNFEAGNVQVSQEGKALETSVSNSNIGYDSYVALPARNLIYDKNNRLLGVTCVDILLTNINQFLGNLEISPRGHIFIIERDGLLIGNSGKYPILHKVNGKTERYSAFNSPNLLIRTIGNELKKQFNSFLAIKEHHDIEVTLLYPCHTLER
jgi:hypothetical protein